MKEKLFVVANFLKNSNIILKNILWRFIMDLENISRKDWLVTLILAFFGGYIGLHRFYCGKIVSGVVYILTFGGVGIGVLVDLILIVCKKFRDIDGALVCKSSIID